MAKFVLAGRSDCPHYARVELLADCLQSSLPDFRITKISILPHEWQEWLDSTCNRNGWIHEGSPMVWRELVDQGGTGMLLGGFSDFLEHCKDYYSVTSDMPADFMLNVAAENLETMMNLVVEEQHRVSLIKPLHIWISSALNPTSSLLIPNLLSAEVFPHVSAISLHLLDLEGNEEGLRWLKMETEDLAHRQLHQVTIHTDLEQAFQEADVILLLDEWWADDSDEEMRRKRKLKAISDSHQFVTMATQLDNEAKAILAKELRVRTSEITNVIVWGNISGSFYIDLQCAMVFNYDGPIKGPAFFSQKVQHILHDRKWLETDFQDLVRCQRAAVSSKSLRAAAMTTANGILAVLKAWDGTCSPDELFSMGVLCPGEYNLPDGVVLSLPVTFTDGKWSALLDLTVGEELRERLQLYANELKQEKALGSENDTIVLNKEDS
ncbi:putative malate dehydrogenase 1B isoform X2 [Pseudoliparis swirei]|uniref:putative malate dehydrogenase 1B isoform X2 n=1 Tax=Pseudoliparis swirei TaxID=2059687 RepID=UPI0024BED38E|nr:putative malate dehydrogenase 1B isoform X2 [Pseudoliparis swirei]